nr:MAG TPA: exopolysaccharide production protein [Caudoviricetes sp.]
MKKLAIILGIMLFCSQAVFADEVLPEQDFTGNRAVVSVQKQPSTEKQNQTVKNNWFCIVVQVNGKVKDSTDNNQK